MFLGIVRRKFLSKKLIPSLHLPKFFWKKEAPKIFHVSFLRQHNFLFFKKANTKNFRDSSTFRKNLRIIQEHNACFCNAFLNTPKILYNCQKFSRYPLCQNQKLRKANTSYFQMLAFPGSIF